MSNYFQKAYRENASKLHQQIGDVLKSPHSIFSSYKIYQEYPVYKVNPNYHHKQHRYDWVILDLLLVIEIHGQQHYHIVKFQNIDNETASTIFDNQKYRDRIKEEAAIQAGYTYIAIPYYDVMDITDVGIYKLYQDNLNTLKPEKEERGPSDYQKQQAEKAREKRSEYNRAQYLKLKEARSGRNEKH